MWKLVCKHTTHQDTQKYDTLGKLLVTILKSLRKNWSLNTQLTGIRRRMIHLENSWSLSWKVLEDKLGSKLSTQQDTQKYDTLGKLLVTISENLGGLKIGV